MKLGLILKMDLKGVDPKIKEQHLFYLRDFIEFSGKHPKQITISDARKYLLYLRMKNLGKSQAPVQAAESALKFFYYELWKKASFSDLECI